MQANDAAYQGTAEAARDESYADIDLAKEKIAKRNNADVSVGDLDNKAVATVNTEHGPDYPTDEQRATLRRVPGGFNFVIFTVAFIEFAERFSYYGCTVVFTNFIQFPLPPGSTTGSIKGLANVNTPGALGKGQQPAFAITTLNTFWVYTTPLLGAYLADAHWGRFKTICIAVGVAIVGHVLLIVCAIPSVITNINTSFGLLVFAIIIMGLGTGAFKSNISPLIAEQIPQRELKVIQRKNGELVIEDPALTVGRVMMYFYLLINCGALSGQIGMVFAEQDVGFWLSYTIPTIVFLATPFVLLWGSKKYNKVPPSGSVLAQVIRLLRLALSNVWTANPAALIRGIRDPAFFERVKPSNVEAAQGEKPRWMTFDDLWVDEVKRGLRACNVFVLFPIYWVCYNQITSNLTSQAATMERNGVPNDLINNLNPISLVIMIPLFDQFIYPALRNAGYNFTAIKRMTLGFFIASIAMMSATITQHYIYRTSPCGNRAATCDEVSPLNVWIQTPTYVLIGISEIFASITGLEYAFNKAPRNMRSLVTSVWLIMQAFSAALGQALGVLSQDPLLVANYGVFSGLSFAAGCLFWYLFRNLDKEENALNDMRRKEDYNDARISAERKGSMPEYGQAPAPASVNVEKRNV